MENLYKSREHVVELLSNLIDKINTKSRLSEVIYDPNEWKDDEVSLLSIPELFNSSDPEIKELVKNAGIENVSNSASLLIKDILLTSEKIENNSYFVEKAQETIKYLNDLLKAKSILFEILDYHMQNIPDYTYNQSNGKLQLVPCKFQKIKLNIVPSNFEGNKTIYISTKPVCNGTVDEFSSYLGDDEFYFKRSSIEEVISKNFVYDLSFGNYYVEIHGDYYPAFFAIEDVQDKIKPFYAGDGVVFNKML